MAGNDYGFTLVTGPVEEPITRDQAKKQLEIPLSDYNHDNHIDLLIKAARERMENETNRQIITATWTLVLDRFPLQERIYLPKAPLQSVTSVTYTDTTGASQTLATSVYKTLSSRSPGYVALRRSQVWPGTYDEDGVVSIIYVCGYGLLPSNVPAGIQQAMMMMIGHWFEHREETVVGTNALSLPNGVQNLIDAYRIGDGYFNYGYDDYSCNG